MKRVITFWFVLIVINGAMAQWFHQNSGTIRDLNSVYFISTNMGFAVGENGTILKTTDGGINWLLVPSGTTAFLSSVYFQDESTGYISGDGVILKTVTFGETWNNLNVDINYYYTDVHFPSSSFGFIVGTKYLPWPTLNVSKVYKTIDSGTNWDSVFYTSGQLLTIFFTSEDTGYVAGWSGGLPSAGILHKTIDSGNNWDECGGQTYTVFRSLQFIDNNTGYWISSDYGIMSGSPRLYRTSNGGTTFSFTELISAIIPNELFFYETGKGFVVGYNEEDDNGIILKTYDDGLTWSSQCTIQNEIFNSIYFPGIDTGYAVGTNGIIYQTTNGGSTDLKEYNFLLENLLLFPNPSIGKITISSPSITGITLLSIFDVNGEKVFERQITDTETQIDISALQRGVYFVRVQDENQVKVAKFIKE